MKSIKIFAAAGAIALLGMAGLSSCKTNNGPEKETPGQYDGSPVKTELLIKIADEAAGTSGDVKYMPGTIVQNPGSSPVFRGMDEIVLIPLKEESSSFVRNGSININLQPGINPDGLIAGSNSTFYPNVAIPTGTKKFRFYSKAMDTDNDVPDTKKHLNGAVVRNDLTDADANAVNFDLVPIYTTAGTPDKAQALANYVTSIANAKTSGASPKGWADYSVSDEDPVIVLLGKFKTLTAGSSNAILRSVTDLYNTLERYKDDGANLDEQDAILTAIMNAIVAHAPVATAAKYANVLAWKTDENATSLAGITTATMTTLGGYPEELKLPEGAAMISWNSSDKKFDVSTSMTMDIAALETADFGGLTSFVYPASLQYYVESAIKTATSSKQAEYNDPANNTWEKVLNTYSTVDVVGSETKSVAIVNSIQYGVGQFKVIVSRENTNCTDNGNNSFGTTETDNLKWKGVLVGDQKPVDYKFEQISSSPKVYTIYDNYLAAGAGVGTLVNVPISPSTTENYTLVFSSKANSSKEDEIYFALEFVNNMAPFIGQGNQLISQGGTFYLVGKLKVDGNTKINTGSEEVVASGSNYRSDFNIFFKDYITTAKVILGADCLKHAYNTIPDLRSSNMELGFSVDLSWQNGLIFSLTL